MNYSSSKNMHPVELTGRVILLAIVLTLLLATSNAYLALKLGILTSASIPAAILSMGILRLFKHPSILENNLVQTAASAGEAVAGGIVYTIPALIIIRYWHHFDYLTNVMIALSGGILGVLFSIPLRRILVNDRALTFPEGRAIAEVLKSSAERVGLRDLVLGGVFGALFDLLQTGFKIIASAWHYWVIVGRTLFGVGIGFSTTMVGAGYLVGFDMAMSILLGAGVAWCIAMPVISHHYGALFAHHSAQDVAATLWANQMRYVGIGAMLFAGFWTLIRLIKPLINSMHLSLCALWNKQSVILRTDKDIPLTGLIVGVFLSALLLFYLLSQIFPLAQIGLHSPLTTAVILGSIAYILVIGFFFSIITAYFSGMVGVTASPGSSVVIAGILFAAWLMLRVLHIAVPMPMTSEQVLGAEAVVIIIGSVVTGIAAIANDNTQDLKVGQLVGATPWKQQLMLLLGVVVSALIIPPVMDTLFDVYGIAGVMPREGMDVGQSLPAPTAALLAALTVSLFQHSLPWEMMACGAFVILFIVVADRLFRLDRIMHLSILGVAIGMYLPIESSTPLIVGGIIARMVDRYIRKRSHSIDEQRQRQQIYSTAENSSAKSTGTLIACGLVAGSALMDVCLAVPFSIFHSADALTLVGPGWYPYSIALGVLCWIVIGVWIRKRVGRA